MSFRLAFDLFIVLWVGVFGLGSVSLCFEGMAAAQEQNAPKLSAKGLILGAQYCKEYDPIDSAVLRIRLEIQNDGALPVILARTPQVAGYRVAKSLEDFTRRR